MHCLVDEFLTPKQISIRRHCSDRAVRKIIYKLKQSGYINAAYRATLPGKRNLEVPQEGSETEPARNQLRNHGHEWHMGIISKDERYIAAMERCNLIYLDGNTIKLSQEAIEVYGMQSFFGDDIEPTFARALEYYQRFFIRLENQLNIILVKPRAQNIKLVKMHWAETNNELAKDCNLHADKINIYARDDGRLWFTIDNSFNLNEAETVHPQRSKEDMRDVIRPFFNDLRENKMPVPSEMWKILGKMVQLQEEQAFMLKETAAGLATIIKLHVPAPIQPESIERDIPEYIG